MKKITIKQHLDYKFPIFLPLFFFLSCTAVVSSEDKQDANSSVDKDVTKISLSDGPKTLTEQGQIPPNDSGHSSDQSSHPQTDTMAPPDTSPLDMKNTCQGINCSNHGKCMLDSSEAAYCECDLAYKAVDLTCINACIGVNCPAGKACVPAHHGVTDPMCVDTCDCSNCGNCAMGDIPSYGVSHCGNASGSPATVTCNKPCPSGMGCIPFSTPICWPGQGCLSM